MANKTYLSKSDISISVLVENKGVHLSFIPTTGGGSLFMTGDEKVQSAIEKHHNFGRLFKLREELVVEEIQEKKGRGKKGKEGEGGESGAEGKNEEDKGGGEKGSEKTVIAISCPEDAKDYLAEKFGISRTTIKTIPAIKKIAAEKNIEFSGI